MAETAARRAAAAPGALPASPWATALAQTRRSLVPVAAAHAFVGWLLWQQGVGPAALLWWVAATAVNAARAWDGGHLAAGMAPPRQQRRSMAAWLLLLGLLESVPLLLLQAWQASQASHYLVTMVLLGLTVGGVSNLAGQVGLYLVWATPLCGVLLVQWLGRGDAVGLGVATLVLLLFGLLGSYVRDYGALLDRERRLAENLRDERDRAQAEMRTRQHFFMSASHDLRQPVSAIRWYCETVRELARQREDETLADLGDGLMRALARTEPMLDQYLEVGRLDAMTGEAAGRADTPKPARALGPWLTAVVQEWRANADARGLDLALDIDDTLARATLGFDEASARRILDNLIGNALKFTPQGAVRVQAAALPVAPPRVQLSVCDTGIGIAAEHLPRLFDDFFQIDDPAHRSDRGSGLGLAIARRYAERLGALITVCSAPGRGSRFTLELPLQIAAADDPRPPPVRADRADTARLRAPAPTLRNHA